MERMSESSRTVEEFLASVEKRALCMAEFAVGREDALDIVQDAMLGLVRHYAKRPAEELRPLFFKILQNRIRDFYRRSSFRSRFTGWFNGFRRDEGGGAGDRGRGAGEDAVSRAESPEGRGPAELVASMDSISAVNAALGDLPLRQQQVFLLRAWEGLSVKETAEAMGCAEGTVKTLYSRAVHTLREALGEFRP
jgi:RNA polymerase sigma-70 factor (ECF subfamily)